MKKRLLNVLAIGLTSMAFVGGLSAQDYPLSDAAKATRQSDRAIQYLSVAGATANDKPVEFETIIAGKGASQQDQIYYDNTLNVLDITKGDKILLSPKAAPGWSWMHYFLFIDYNQNKQFEENELVSFAYVKEGDKWVDSKGNQLSSYNGELPATMPDFLIPEDALKGATRARFLCQWDNKDPKGAAQIAANRGTICDFTINIHEKGEVVAIATEKLPSPTTTVEAGELLVGKYNDKVEVSINHATEGVTLYYTTDGGNPSRSSQVYSDKLTFTETTTLKVVAVKEGFKPSDILTVVYKVRDSSKYEVWDETKRPRSNTDRVVQQLKVEGATLDGNPVEFTENVAGENATSQSKIYFDNTADVLNATIGDEITVSPKVENLHWTHFYLYIDYNKNKVFEDNELVSFSHFSADGKAYVNSLGETVQPGEVAAKLPAFTIPEDAQEGETRIRFKADWNSKDAAGSTLAKDRGTLCDFTINIHKKAETKKTFAVKYTAEEDGGTVALKKEDGTVVAPDTEVEEGTKLTLEVTAKEGKTIDKVVVNGVEKELKDGKVELTITEALDVKITYGTAAAINELEATNVKVYNQAGTIVVEGAEMNTKALVYNAQGILVDTFTVTSEQTQAKLKLQRGLYLVKLGAKTYKVML